MPSQPTLLRGLVIEALKAKGLKQKDLAAEIGIHPSLLSEHLNNRRSMPSYLVLRLADKLGLPEDQALLAHAAGECTRQSERLKAPEDRERLKTGAQALTRALLALQREKAATLRPGFVTLANFPFGDAAVVVITGDRREKPPQGLGDLIGLSASMSDLMYFSDLGLRAGTPIRSDKPIASHLFRERASSNRPSAAAGERPGRTRSLKRHLLLVGSPAVCLATRLVLKRGGATFQFNIGPWEFAQEEAIYGRIGQQGRYDSDELERVQEAERKKINGLLASFRKAGFVDPVDFRGIRGRSMSSGVDYGIVALAQNPWSQDHLVCICAGVHGPGTAGAIQLLSMREEFAERPWGGVFTVTVPSEAPWEERYSYLNPKWDTHAYTPDEYLEGLDKLIAGVSRRRASRFSDVQVDPARLESVRRFTTERLLEAT